MQTDLIDRLCEIFVTTGDTRSQDAVGRVLQGVVVAQGKRVGAVRVLDTPAYAVHLAGAKGRLVVWRKDGNEFGGVDL